MRGLNWMDVGSIGMQIRRMMMFANLVYRGLPTSLLLALSAIVQYYAIRAFA